MYISVYLSLIVDFPHNKLVYKLYSCFTGINYMLKISYIGISLWAARMARGQTATALPINNTQ